MPVDVAAYLRRIDAPAPDRPDAAALADLQHAHLRAVPFENLSIHLGEPIRLDLDTLLDKIVTRGRGGFCYEVNGAFAWLLTELGYSVRLLAARVYSGERLGPPFDHVALRVDLDEPWLVDVGFGAFTARPLRLAERGDQLDDGTVFRVVAAPHGDLDVLEADEPQYRLEQHPRELTEFAAMCWYQQHSPDSHFTRSPVCSRLTDTGRITLTGRTLKRDGTHKTTLKTPEQVLTAYRDHFDLTLDRVPDDPREA